MTDFDKLMETELLKRVSEKGKVNLMTEIQSIMSCGQLSCLCHSSLATYVQKQFLKSNLMFSYDLLQSRNGVKIVGLSKGCSDKNEDIELITSFNSINTDIAIHLLNQFYEVKNKVDIMSIAAIYDSIIELTGEIGSLVNLNNTLIDIIYNHSKKDFTSKQHIEMTLEDIKRYGYCLNKDDETYWKIFKSNTQMNTEQIKDFFTVMEEVEDIIEEEKPVIIQEKIVNKDFTTSDALNLLAKELGLASIENTKSKLEEVLAVTDELVNNFDSMQDWEKLMNWKNFVSDWKIIMGDALNDNN